MAKQVQVTGERIGAKETTREKLIIAAGKLFRSHGYEKVSIRDIASEMGMSTGAIFNIAKDKPAMFLLAMGEPAPDVPQFLTRIIDLETSTTREEKPDVFFEISEHAKVLRSHLVGEGG